MTTSRLAFRLDRFELLSIGLIVIAISAAAFWVSLQLDGVRPPLECLTDTPPEPPACIEAEAFFAQRGLGDWLMIALVAAPFVLGILLGSALGAKEIEHGWAQLTWSLDGRTGTWFLRRYLVILAVVLALGTLLGVAGQILESSMLPSWDPSTSFHNFGSRGVPLVVRAAAAFSIAVLVALLLGRALPSIIVAGLLCVGVWVGVTTQNAAWIPPTPESVSDVDGSYRIAGIAYRNADGVFTPEEIAAQNPHRFQSRPYWSWIEENYELVSMIVPGESYGQAVMGEAAVLAGGSVLAFVLAVVTVRRRRPTT